MTETTGRVTIRDLVGAIKTTIEPAISSVKQTQANEGISESIPETPLVQVYFEKRDPQGTNTDRNTFGGKKFGEKPIRVKQTTIHVDVYARQRSSIGQDLATAQDLADELDELFEEQVHKPYFGIPQLEAFRYRVERVVFEYNNVKYSGIRFVFEITIM